MMTFWNSPRRWTTWSALQAARPSVVTSDEGAWDAQPTLPPIARTRASTSARRRLVMGLLLWQRRGDRNIGGDWHRNDRRCSFLLHRDREDDLIQRELLGPIPERVEHDPEWRNPEGNFPP